MQDKATNVPQPLVPNLQYGSQQLSIIVPSFARHQGNGTAQKQKLHRRSPFPRQVGTQIGQGVCWEGPIAMAHYNENHAVNRNGSPVLANGHSPTGTVTLDVLVTLVKMLSMETLEMGQQIAAIEATVRQQNSIIQTLFDRVATIQLIVEELRANFSATGGMQAATGMISIRTTSTVQDLLQTVPGFRKDIRFPSRVITARSM